MKWNLKNRWFALLGVFVFVATVAASGYNNYSKTANDAVGDMALAYAAIDSTILDGTVVIVDTLAGSPIDRIAVRPIPATGSALLRPRCIGLAVGNIPASSTNSPGRILLTGYHPRAKMATSAVASGLVKVSVTVHGALATSVDSTGTAIGWLIHMNAGISNGRYTGAVILTKPCGSTVVKD